MQDIKGRKQLIVLCSRNTYETKDQDNCNYALVVFHIGCKQQMSSWKKGLLNGREIIPSIIHLINFPVLIVHRDIREYIAPFC